MSLGSYSMFASVLSLIGLLSFAPEQAQRGLAREGEALFNGANDSHQVGHQPIIPGSLPTPKAAPPKDVASESRAEATASTTARALTKPELKEPLTLTTEGRPSRLD